MTSAVALILGALLVGWVVPRHLLRIDLRRRDPAPVIVAWLLSIVGFLLAGAVGVLLLIAPDHGTLGGLATALQQCWVALQHGSPPKAEELFGLLGVGVILAGFIRFAIVAIAQMRRIRLVRREQLCTVRLAARAEGDHPRTLWLDHDRPLAFSFAGKPGVIVATEGLKRHLSAEGVAAVLAHERAHLRGRHHLLITIINAASRTLPFVPLFREAPAALRELVELAADVEAVRRHGQSAVRAALLGVTQHRAPLGALSMAQDAVDIRLARLTSHAQPPRRTDRMLSCGMAGAGAAMLPFIVGGSLLLAVAAVACPV